MKGEIGLPGDPGLQGLDGVIGIKGEIGDKGAKGEIGDRGAPGPTGSDGYPGECFTVTVSEMVIGVILFFIILREGLFTYEKIFNP